MLRFSEEDFEKYLSKKKINKNSVFKKEDLQKELKKKESYNKYGAVKVEYDGISFDSTGEMERYSELKTLESLCLIDNLVLQPRFTLQDSFECDGKKYRKIEYVADFMYYDKKTGKTIVEDFKGCKTKEYNLKKNCFYINIEILSLWKYLKSKQYDVLLIFLCNKYVEKT